MIKPGTKVLIIDDEEDLLHMVALRLEKLGFQVQCALDGTQGLEAARTFLPHHILLDVNMPGLSGWEVLQQLRNDARFSQTKVILFTTTRDLKYAKELGADQVVLKPFNPEELVSILTK